MLLTDLIQFIKENRNKGKRVCFKLKYLDEWIEWAFNKNYLFVSKDKEIITGVLTVCPIGKWSEVPTIEQIVDSMGKNHTDTDYYIMDILVTTTEARKDLIQKALNRFDGAESNPDTKLFGCWYNRIIKLKKPLILTLKN